MGVYPRHRGVPEPTARPLSPRKRSKQPGFALDLEDLEHFSKLSSEAQRAWRLLRPIRRGSLVPLWSGVNVVHLEHEATVSADYVNATDQWPVMSAGKGGVFIIHNNNMGYYVVSDGEGVQTLTSWPAAQRALKDAPGRSCRSFRFKSDAVRFIEGLRHAEPAAPGELVVYVDGAVDHGVRGFGSSYFGPDDPRNGVWALEGAPPYTAPRAELLAALRGVELAGGAPVVILSDCEFVCRAYRERFPSSWANQDLMRRLALSCDATGARIRRGHSGDPGSGAAHALCNYALRLAKEEPNH